MIYNLSLLKNKKLMKYFSLLKSENFFSLILFFIIIFKFYIVGTSFGSSDLTGLSHRYLFQYNSFDWNETGKNLLPYFPFVEIIYFYIGKIADFFSVNYVFIIKYISVAFEIFIAFLIVKFFENKKKDNININLLLILILLNPLSLYVNGFMGFFESIWIFFIILTVYLHEFRSDHNKFIFIPFFLALSVSIKPVALFFVFFFYYKNNYKKLFIFTFLLTFIFLQAPYLMANFGNEDLLLTKTKHIFTKFLIGHQQGQYGLSEIEKLIKEMFNLNFFYFFKLFKIIELLILFLIYYFCLISNKIKSYEFIYLILLAVLLLNDNLHTNYLYWILPFAMLLNYKKSLYFSILIIFVILNLETKENYQLLLFNFPNYFNFLSEVSYDNSSLAEINKYEHIIKILFFYLSLLFLFEKKTIMKINLNQISFEKLGKIFKDSFNFNEKLFPLKKFKLTKLYFFPLCLFIFYITQASFLVDIFKPQNDFDKNNVVIPNNLTIYDTHGNNLKFTTNFQSTKDKDYEIIYITGYYSSLQVNNKKVNSGFNILHFIHDKFPWEKDNNKFVFKKIKINEFLKDGHNNIMINSNIPHSYKSFGLIFFLLEDQKLIKSTEKLDWQVYLNKEKTNYYFEKIKENNYIKENFKLKKNYTSLSLNTKILKFNKIDKFWNLDPRVFLTLVLIFISVFCFVIQSLICKSK